MSTSRYEGVPCRSDGSFDVEAFTRRAHAERAAYLREIAFGAVPSLPTLSPKARRSLSLSAAALALATAAFWAIMLISPPQTKASAIDSTALAPAAHDRCEIGTEVSNFVCRNTWMIYHRYSYR
jgi:hypothetical protein